MFLFLFLTPKLRITARMAEKREKTRNFQNSSDFFWRKKTLRARSLTTKDHQIPKTDHEHF